VFATLGVLNIVTGFFVDGTMQATASQKDQMLQMAQDRKNAMVEMIGDLFQQLDNDQSGKISKEELESHLFEENLQEYFLALEMEPSDALDLFRMLDMGNTGEVSIEDFTKGCLRTMGTAKNFDVTHAWCRANKSLICWLMEEALKLHAILEEAIKLRAIHAPLNGCSQSNLAAEQLSLSGICADLRADFDHV